MSTPFQRQVELRILQHLHARLHFGNGSVSLDGMYEWFCKDTNISRARFDNAFTSLNALKYFVEQNVAETQRYGLSSFGVDWIEDYYNFFQPDPSKQSLRYTPKFEGTIMIGTRRKAYLDQIAAEETGRKVAVDISTSARWTRSGAVAAWLALPVAIIAILITIMLAKK